MTMLTASEVAKQLAISGRKVYALASAGALASHRFGSAVRFSQEDVDAYVRASRQPVAPRHAVRAPTLYLATSAEHELTAYFARERAARAARKKR